MRVGSWVFGASAIVLLIAPALFLSLLKLDVASDSLQWSMRMIGLTLIALSANMWFVSRSSSDRDVMRAGVVMAVVATLLGVLTLAIPAERSWFTWLYVAVGLAFGFNYAVCLLRKRL